LFRFVGISKNDNPKKPFKAQTKKNIMKTFKHLLTLVLVFAVMVACKNEAKPEVKTVETEAKAEKQLDPNAEYAKAEFTVEGMTCAIGCAATIEKKIAKMDGVKSAKVDFDKKLAMVEYDVAKVTTASLEETVKKTGGTYSVANMKTVDTFAAKEQCPPDCKKECCADKKADVKKETACNADCKMSCCMKEGKA